MTFPLLACLIAASCSKSLDTKTSEEPSLTQSNKPAPTPEVNYFLRLTGTASQGTASLHWTVLRPPFIIQTDSLVTPDTTIYTQDTVYLTIKSFTIYRKANAGNLKNYYEPLKTLPATTFDFQVPMTTGKNIFVVHGLSTTGYGIPSNQISLP